MTDRPKRTCRRRTFAMIRDEERRTHSKFIDGLADRYEADNRKDLAAGLRAVSGSILTGLAAPETKETVA